MTFEIEHKTGAKVLVEATITKAVIIKNQLFYEVKEYPDVVIPADKISKPE